MKTILLFRSSFCRSNNLEYKGVFNYAKKHNWRIQTVEYSQAFRNRYRIDSSSQANDIKSLLSFWAPDGCIVECGIAPQALMLRDFRGVPVVFLDRDPSTIEPDAVCIYSNSADIASTAAKELFKLGLNDFAFLEWSEPVSWSKERGDEFEKIINKHGKNFFRFRMPLSKQPESDFKLLKKFLLSLPAHCGLFTANDLLAKSVVSACSKASIAIPERLAIISVDNDEDICNHGMIPISSIELDCIGAGEEAGRLLDQLMSNSRTTPHVSLFGVNQTIRRVSAPGFAHLDKNMIKALEFIRTHVQDHLTVPDVIQAVGWSRRMADLRFRVTLNHTILDEIHLRKMELAKQLPRKGKSIDEVGATTGYSSTDDFRRVFRRYIGTSPLKWKKAAKVSIQQPS